MEGCEFDFRALERILQRQIETKNEGAIDSVCGDDFQSSRLFYSYLMRRLEAVTTIRGVADEISALIS